jgi:hypothetical protein
LKPRLAKRIDGGSYGYEVWSELRMLLDAMQFELILMGVVATCSGIEIVDRGSTYQILYWWR